MKNRILFILAGIGAVLGIWSAIIYSKQPPAQPPVYQPASNPYAAGIYAEGIIESDQEQGENVNLYPEVTGPITRVWVKEGAAVRKGTPLVSIDETVQRATAEEERSQAEAAHALLEELIAQPRPENLAVAAAQLENARATLKNADDQLEKQEHSYALEPQSVSRDALDNARNAEKMAATNLAVVERQYELTKAGAWSYDVRNQEKQAQALDRAAAAAEALLAKYTLRAPIDGIVLAVQSTVGAYVSPQGAYDTYTQGYAPLLVMGSGQGTLDVRCYVDEILVHRLPDPSKIKAEMVIHGTQIHVPLSFVRMQPFVSPKIELSDQREERVDVRVLPLIFRFENPKNVHVYPGQLVDVYVGE